jgi:hypothetical protein
MARNTRTMHSWYLKRFPIVSARPAAFSPASIPNLALWLDAADASTITVDGSNNVSEWRDKSGNARHLTQGTALNRPSYVTGVLNGLPVVRPDGVNDFLESSAQTAATWYGSGTQQITVMLLYGLVAQDPAKNNLVGGLNTAVGGGTNRVLFERQPVGIGTSDAIITAGGTSQFITAAPQAGTAWFIETIRWTNGGTPTMRRTNTAGTNTYNGAGTLTGTMADNQKALVGYGATLAANFNAAEKLIYARNISDTEVAQIEAAWLAKWGTI